MSSLAVWRCLVRSDEIVESKNLPVRNAGMTMINLLGSGVPLDDIANAVSQGWLMHADRTSLAKKVEPSELRDDVTFWLTSDGHLYVPTAKILSSLVRQMSTLSG